MDESSDVMTIYWNGVQSLLNDNRSGVDFRAFSHVSERILSEYRDLSAGGMPGQTITLAMLGATLNMCNMFGTHEQLPKILRDLADVIDRNRNLH